MSLKKDSIRNIFDFVGDQEILICQGCEGSFLKNNMVDPNRVGGKKYCIHCGRKNFVASGLKTDLTKYQPVSFESVIEVAKDNLLKKNSDFFLSEAARDELTEYLFFEDRISPELEVKSGFIFKSRRGLIYCFTEMGEIDDCPEESSLIQMDELCVSQLGVKHIYSATPMVDPVTATKVLDVLGKKGKKVNVLLWIDQLIIDMLKCFMVCWRDESNKTKIHFIRF